MKNFEFKEQTLVIIKPDAVENGSSGKIIKRFEDEGFFVKAIKILKLEKEQVEDFYLEHKRKSFFSELSKYMCASCIFVLLIEGKSAVDNVRRLVGHTDPKKAASKSLRAMYGEDINKNAVHASDSIFSAIREINFFFKDELNYSSEDIAA